MRELNNMLLMHKDVVIAEINNGLLSVLEPSLMPYFLKRTGDLSAWLSGRAIDRHRTNSRLLKKALRLESKDDIDTVLYVNAVTITDNYWVKQADDTLTYQDVRFKTNLFDKLALYGDVNSLDSAPAPTPELTNTGSFEKCWTRSGNSWYMLKAGTPQEQFSEIFSYKAGRFLGLNMAEYHIQGAYVMTKDFTENARYDFDPAFGMIGEETDYIKIYEALKSLCPKAASEYVNMCYLDALIFNFDRHEHNFGLLRDSGNGKPVCLAPLFDHNLSLVARGYRQSRNHINDQMIRDFAALLRHAGGKIDIRRLDKSTLNKICRSIPFSLPRDEGVYNPRAFVVDFVLQRQESIFEKCGEFVRVREPNPPEPEL